MNGGAAGGLAPVRRAPGAVLALAFFALVAVLVFHALWPRGALLLSTDENIGALASQKRMLEHSVVHPWQGDTLWGFAHASSVRPSFFLLHWMDAERYLNMFHGIALVAGAWFLALYLRGKGLRWSAAAFGALAAFWLGTNLTLAHAGHIGKYGVMVFFSMTLWALGNWSRTRRGAWAVVAAGAAGAMFLEQGDIALFCTAGCLPVVVAEWTLAWPRAADWKAPRRWLAELLPAALALGLLVGGATLSARDAGQVDSAERMGLAERWDFLTQWSQPPDESMDFIAPGWMGWRSDHPEAPYWGRTGRGTGFPNFRAEGVYVGFLPVALALLGLCAPVLPRRLRWAWGTVLAATLVLSFGKYTPFYRPLASLPGFGAIRNPNKFLHVAQVALGVLAGAGLDALLRGWGGTRRKWWVAGFGAAAAVALVCGAVAWSGEGTGALRFLRMGWTRNASLALSHVRATALLWLGAGAGVAAGVCAICVWAPAKPRRGAGVLACGWAVMEAALILAPQYIVRMPAGNVAPNALTEVLDRELAPGRLAFVPGDPRAQLFNYWLTCLFPHRGYDSVNVTQLPRPPADYVAFWNAVRDPVRQWQLTGVRWILAGADVASALVNGPHRRDVRAEEAYRVSAGADGAVALAPLPAGSAPRPEDVLLLRLVAPSPRVALMRSWRSLPADRILPTLASPAWMPFSEVLFDSGDGIPDASGTVAGAANDAFVPLDAAVSCIGGAYRLKVHADGPAVLRFSERFDPGWRATLDGRSVPVLRCDSMFLAVHLPDAGDYEVALDYAPGTPAVPLETAGIALAAVALAVALRPRRRPPAPAAVPEKAA